jgi:hypothetical protein
VLADLGTGSGKFTFKFFDDMLDPLQEAGVRFLAIGVVTSEVATTETIFNWANALKSRTDSRLCAIIATVMISVFWKAASPDSGS